ncbi:TerC family protein [uncultured Ferrovibrio sp.]|jgi:YjbE family integral membrane protein|uniref:TerC family protein n=1 Tax=uncultured Ferrovibrio sp. TaxID=1576913 RepID=UPI002615DE7C|nr:TerC family protein [uncultured Ferrovibrio sp.]
MDISLFGLTVTAAEISAFLQVILIDVILSGDNAIVIGMAVAGLPAKDRNKIIIYGILAATALRILFAGIAVQLLQIIGLTLAGGILLLWVAWKMWRELREQAKADAAEKQGIDSEKPAPKTRREAVLQIIMADVSMSLDNVLAVAGAAREHPFILAFGLMLSIALMAVASKFIARLLDRYHWIAYIGLLIIAYVALRMIWDGGWQVAPFVEGVLNGN